MSWPPVAQRERGGLIGASLLVRWQKLDRKHTSWELCADAEAVLRIRVRALDARVWAWHGYQVLHRSELAFHKPLSNN